MHQGHNSYKSDSLVPHIYQRTKETNSFVGTSYKMAPPHGTSPLLNFHRGLKSHSYLLVVLVIIMTNMLFFLVVLPLN